MKFVCIALCLFLRPLVAFPQEKEGPVFQTKGSTKGFVLFAPLYSKTTYLIDKCGDLVHSWTSNYAPAQSVYLLPDGSLLRAANDTLPHEVVSVGGRIERFDWNNNLLWSYVLSSNLERQHHDIYPMPNGNVLAIVYRKKSIEEAAAAGRKTADMERYLLEEKIEEIKPIGRDSGIIVWEWDAWDHLIQDNDPKAANYGVVAKNPQLLNINYIPTPGMDWLHFNGISYNAELDQIMVSIHEFSEIFILDHSTTTAQAASHKGGNRGKGGDLLYRWGNPIAYNAGKAEDQKLFRQHHAHWIEKGRKDHGKIMVFNNGPGRPGSALYSSVDILDPPVDKHGNYRMEPEKATLPLTCSWSYTAADPTCFFSNKISSAQRLANGNTLICAGHIGKFFEIDANKNTVWTFINRAGITESSNPQIAKRGGESFRCTFYEPDYNAFKGRDMKACEPSEIGSLDPCFSK